MIRGRHILLLMLLVVVLHWSAHTMAAQGNGWSQPIELSDAQKTGSKVSWYPDLAVGSDGSVNVVWCSFPRHSSSSGETKYFDTLMYRVLRDGKWSAINDVFSQARQLASGIEYTVRNSIVAGRDGRLHVLLRDRVTIKQFSAPLQSAWSAREWSPQRAIGGGYYNALATDSKGALYALRTETVPDDPKNPRKECPGCAHLFFSRSTDGGDLWSSRFLLSEGMEGANRPQIKVDRRDRIHVVWDEGFDWYAGKGSPKTGIYRHSDDGGETWGAPVVFSLPGDTIQQTALALTGDGNPLVVYRSVKGGRIYFQRSPDGGTTWSQPAEIPGVQAIDTVGRGLDIFSMATDSADHVHLVMVGFRDGEDRTQTAPSLMELSWDGNAWLAPETIMQRVGYQPEWPRIVAAGGNQLHVVWFTRHELPTQTADEDPRFFQVWYSSKLINSPAVTALPLFTPTPVLAMTPTQPPPTHTPVPTLPPAIGQTPPIGSRPAWESSGMVTIGIALLPLVGLLAVLWTVTRLVYGRRG